MNQQPDRWFYMGLTDDVVRRYGMQSFDLKADPLDHIVESFILGKKPILHQSATLIQRPFVEDLLSPKHSILRALSEHDELRILSSEGDFVGWVKQSIENGAYSDGGHWQLASTKEWTDHLLTRTESLEAAATHLRDSNKLLAFPRRNPSSLLYASLLTLEHRRPASLSKDTWDTFFGLFRRTFEAKLHEIDCAGQATFKYPPTRTIWEKAAKSVFRYEPLLLSQMMAVANEHYHRTFALALASELARPLDVLTTWTGTWPQTATPVSDGRAGAWSSHPVGLLRYSPSKVRRALPKLLADLSVDAEFYEARTRYCNLVHDAQVDQGKLTELQVASRTYEAILGDRCGYTSSLKTEFNRNEARVDTLGRVFPHVAAAGTEAAIEHVKDSLGAEYQPLTTLVVFGGALLSKATEHWATRVTRWTIDRFSRSPLATANPASYVLAQPVFLFDSTGDANAQLLQHPEVRPHVSPGKLELKLDQLPRSVSA